MSAQFPTFGLHPLHELWFMDTVSVALPLMMNETWKWLTPLPLSHAESFWWWRCSIICMHICGLTQVKWNLVAYVGMLISASVACCVSVTSWLCECYQLVVWVLPADSVNVTGWLCQCYQLILSVLPAGCVSVTGWLCQCYWLVGSVLLAGWVSVTSWLDHCYWLVGSVLPAGWVSVTSSPFCHLCVCGGGGGVIIVSGMVGNGCDPLRDLCLTPKPWHVIHTPQPVTLTACRASQQVDQEPGKGQQAGHNQAVWRQLHASAGELHPVWHTSAAGERGRGAGPHPGAGAAEADLQAAGCWVHPAGGQRHWVLPGLQALHHHASAEPTLPAGSLRQGTVGWFVLMFSCLFLYPYCLPEVSVKVEFIDLWSSL